MSSTLSLGLAAGFAPTDPWWLGGAILDADFANSRFYFANGVHESEASWLRAVGGNKTGNGCTIGPYIAPTAPSLLTNGDFSEDGNGWSGYNGGTIAIADGEAVLAANGATSPGFSRSFTAEPGRAYRLSGSYRRGTLAGGCGIMLGPNASLNGGSASPTNGTSTAMAGIVIAGAESAQLYAGGRAFTSGAQGTAIFDDLAVQEATPFAGFQSQGFSALIAATTPSSSSSGEQVLFQTDHGATQASDNTARNRLRIFWGTDRHVRLQVDFAGVTTVQLDLGEVPISHPFQIAFSVQNDNFRAALVGRPIQAVNSGVLPGLAVMRIGRSYAGEAWQGVVERIVLFPMPHSDIGFAGLAGSSRAIVAWGDSLTTGANASTDAARYPQAAQLLFSPPRGVLNMGVGGQLSTEIAARQGGLPVRLTLAGNEIAASGAMAVTAHSVGDISGISPLTAQGPQSMRGTLAGIAGTLRRQPDGSHSFERAIPGNFLPLPQATLFLPEAARELANRVQWFWAGRNGAVTERNVEADIAAMVAALDHDHFLVGANLTSADDDPADIAAIQTRNATLAATYGMRFVDLYAALQSAGNGSEGDDADVFAGLTPRSLRSDPVHLNDAGYAIVAGVMYAATLAMGW